MKRCKVENISEADEFIAEAKYLRDLSHKYIVYYVDDFIHIEFSKGKIEPIYFVVIIMEFCEGGDLKKKIDDVYNAKSSFSSSELINILIQICESLNYLHNRNVIHRDIKSQNIFFTKDNVVRIGDFGLAKKLKKNRRNTLMTKVGTDSYMAPEVIKGENYGKPVGIIA
jgi:NIMA (never in mitosis gene a)-related kinase